MKLTLMKKGIFGKKYLKIPEKFLSVHELLHGKKAPIHGVCNEKFIVISSDENLLEDKDYLINDLLDNESVRPDYTLKFSSTREQVEYKDVEGFFCFRGVIYFKTKGVAGKCMNDLSTNFSTSVKERFPDEFRDYTLPKIGTIKVTPIKVM